MIHNITIGADPELFIVDHSQNDKVISSIGLIPGEKGNPYKADDMPNGFGMEIDNILGEFNIPPTDNRTSFINNINYMKNYIDNFIKQKNPNYGIQCIASRIVDDDQLTTPESQMFGCSVDYNAYTKKANKKPSAKDQNLRSAGLHLHVGYDFPTTDISLNIVKLLDIYLGIPSVILDPDKKRRKLYGKAGAFRLCKYGVEYRSLSSYMMSDDNILSLVWDLLVCALYTAISPDDYDSDKIQYIINNSDVDLAKEFWAGFKPIQENPRNSRILKFNTTFEV